MTALLLAVELALFGASIVLLRSVEARRIRRSIVTYRLSFPRGLEAEGVESFVSGLSGLLLPAWKRWLICPFVSIEVHASSRGIEHFVLVPERWSASVESVLQAALPSVRFRASELPVIQLKVGAEYRISDHRRSLRVEPASINAKLLASLQPLSGEEVVAIQWLVTPHGPVMPARATNTGKDNSSLGDLILNSVCRTPKPFRP